MYFECVVGTNNILLIHVYIFYTTLSKTDSVYIKLNKQKLYSNRVSLIKDHPYGNSKQSATFKNSVSRGNPIWNLTVMIFLWRNFNIFLLLSRKKFPLEIFSLHLTNCVWNIGKSIYGLGNSIRIHCQFRSLWRKFSARISDCSWFSRSLTP